MKWNRSQRLTIAGAVLGLLAGCTDHNTPTALPNQPELALDASASLTSVVTDPLGDAKLNHHNSTGPGSDQKIPDYLDVVRAEVSRQGNTFVFIEDVGDVVPSNPTTVSGSLGIQAWILGLDTDPTTAPPHNNGNAFPFEFFVDVEWDGTQFAGKLYDRRPLLTGGEAVVTPASFTIDGAEIRLFVAASSVDSPSTFAWLAGTLSRHSDGINGYQTLDVAPNTGLATWPQ